MSLEHVLLGLLREPASGYDLRRSFEQGAAHFWAARLSQIYPTLQKMEEQGWLSSRQQPSEKGPPRRVYRRTARGRRQLRRWLASEPEFPVERLGYVGQLMFMGALNDLRHTREFVSRLRSAFSDKLSLLEHPAAALREIHESDPAALPVEEFHYLIGLELGVRVMRSRVQWCDDCLEMIAGKLEADGNA